MDRVWTFLKGLLGWRKDESAEQHPHVRLGQGDYTKDIWLDGHRWTWCDTNRRWINKKDHW